MVGQLLLPSVALATECADPAAGTDEVAAAPVTADGCGGYGCNDRTSCFDRACNRCCSGGASHR